MKRILISVIVVLAFGGLVVLNEMSYHHGSNKERLVSKLDNDYDNFAILKLMNNKQNVIYSPLSIRYALSMLREGALDNTKQELDNFLGESDLSKYDNIDQVLSVANAMFVKTGYKVKDNYINTLKDKYLADLKYDDFTSPDQINDWIFDKTFGLIKNPLDDLNPETKLVLVNALAMIMGWDVPFDCANTKGDDFILANGDKLEATMMSNETRDEAYAYYVSEEVTAVSIDLKKYNDTQFEFVAIMPQDLEKYIKDIKLSDIEEITNKMTKASDTDSGIIVNIPKFSFNTDLELKDSLIELGVKDIFSEDANFSNIAAKLFVNRVKHVAKIDFSEEGIKAAAVTIIVMKDNAIQVAQPVSININKPFMFIIRDKNTKDIFFVGTVYQPNKWADDASKYKVDYDY